MHTGIQPNSWAIEDVQVSANTNVPDLLTLTITERGPGSHLNTVDVTMTAEHWRKVVLPLASLVARTEPVGVPA